MSATVRRLSEIYKKARVIPFDKNSKFIIMSDCHRGQGNNGDNFLPNQMLHFGALEYYYNNGFTYIELGDGDELWENHKLKRIIDAHSDVFWLMSKFYNENRFYMLYGNHDVVKRRSSIIKQNFDKYYCDSSKCMLPLFPGMRMIPEGLILEHKESKKRIFLVHGHQGSFLNDTLWPVARFLVRYIWSPLEMIGFAAPTWGAGPHNKKEKIERTLSSYAEQTQQMLIAGHTHRPYYPEPGNSLYFNDGSCVHPRCITGIEIENDRIALIKWTVNIREDRSLYVSRRILEGPDKIVDFYK